MAGKRRSTDRYTSPRCTRVAEPYLFLAMSQVVRILLVTEPLTRTPAVSGCTGTCGLRGTLSGCLGLISVPVSSPAVSITFTKQIFQPSWCESQARKPPLLHTSSSGACTPHQPPPKMANDHPRQTLRCTVVEDVYREEGVWEILDWNSDEAHDGRLCAWWG